MPYNRAKAARYVFSVAGFFPILQQRIDFRHIAIRCAAGIAVESEAGERTIDAVNRRMAEKFAPQVEIGGEFAAVWDAGADLLPETATPEDGFLLDEIGVFGASVHAGVVAPAGESRHFLHPLEAAVLLNTEFSQGSDPLDLGKFLENLANGGEGPREVEIGGIEPAHDVTRGFGEAFVDGCVLPAIGFAAPECERVGMALDDFATAVGGSAIDNNILQIRPAAVGGKQDALDRLVQVRGLVVGRGDDGNFHEGLRQKQPASGLLKVARESRRRA